VSAGALVDELAADGVRLSLAGDDLCYQTQPGASIAPYQERIREHKPAVLAELRRRAEIVAAASAVHARFDRQHFDELWRRWSELQEEAT
jgi:hypothetical protein